ncbi:MAG: tRNA epoxyqueuosine(34) reductase QueG [Candidatus Dormibacteraeota bacterium]|nr:tRNA epoxyqueuosine(34) reductase QueG [Candidatus Dormibacteraeota bacterium]
MSLSDDLKTRSRELGFVAAGVTGAEPFDEAEAAALARTAEGKMDGLPWWSADRVRASAGPRQRTPAAQSIVALAFPYAPPAAAEPDPDGPRGRIAAYALGRDYHEVLSERMQPLVEMLRSRGHQAKTYVDHGWMLDRAAGARAGVGWLGKNTNLLVPGVGSYVLLSEIVTSAEIERDLPSLKSCGSCQSCLRACPTGALVAPGVLDNRLCISFWTIEHHGVIPLEMRPLIGNWIFGCDLCQEVCPVNAYPRRAEPDPAALEAFGPQTVSGRPWLEDLLALDEPGFRERFRASAVWRTRRAGLLRNVCIALGNAGERSAVSALAGALADHEALLRGHAAWALGRLGGAAARRHLERALSREDDGWVRDEIELALAGCGPLAVL